MVASESKIARILREHGLVDKSGRTGRKKAPKPSEEQYVEENLIKDKFQVSKPNYLWCSDITELICKGSKVYVCIYLLDVVYLLLIESEYL